MINRLFFYIELAFKDLWRFKGATIPQLFIVTGICLPVFILVALKRGQVDELWRSLVTSPNGTVIKAYLGRTGNAITLDDLESFRQKLGKCRVAYPNHRVLVSVDSGNSKLKNVELWASVEGDPVLKSLNLDLLKSSSNEIVLSTTMLRELQVTIGDHVEIECLSNSGNSLSHSMVIAGELVENDGNKTGYVHSIDLDRIYKFQRGSSVDEWGWKNEREGPDEEYDSYLLVVDASTPLVDSDFAILKSEFGLSVSKVEDINVRSIYGAIEQSHVHAFDMYELKFTTKLQPLTLSPDSIIRKTLATDAIIAWTSPITCSSNIGDNVRLVGTTIFGKAKWLEKLFSESSFFRPQDDWRQCYLTSGNRSEKEITVHCEKGIALTLKNKVDSPEQVSVPPGEREATNIVYVHSRLLSNIVACLENKAQCEPEVNEIFRVNSNPSYSELFFFADSVHDVEQVKDLIEREGWLALADVSSIREITKQVSMLNRLVFIVGAAVLFFGVLTVFWVLWESTSRKSGTIGIMKVMGVSRRGMFFIVFARASLLALASAILTLSCGLVLIQLLNPNLSGRATQSAIDQESTQDYAHSPTREQTPAQQIRAFVTLPDVALIFCAAFACCGLGALVPSIIAARRDAFALVSIGRFR